MKIGIIGAGNVGRPLATASVRAGHAVTITAPHAETTGIVKTSTRQTCALATQPSRCLPAR